MWRDCEVTDISMFGLGITLHHPQPWELVHRRILVCGRSHWSSERHGPQITASDQP